MYKLITEEQLREFQKKSWQDGVKNRLNLDTTYNLWILWRSLPSIDLEYIEILCYSICNGDYQKDNQDYTMAQNILNQIKEINHE